MQIHVWELLALGHLPDKFGDDGHCDSGDITFLICYVTSREHMLKGLCESMRGSLSSKVATLPCLMAIGLVQVEIKSI